MIASVNLHAHTKENATEEAGARIEVQARAQKKFVASSTSLFRRLNLARTGPLAPDRDARRVKVNLTGDSLDMAAFSRIGEAFVAKNNGTEKTELRGHR
jgi:hypothetical protein